ncbi:heme-binding protein [Mycolicibacterium sp. lyk4-40-TYG-92]|uniref:SOUL family heme-binding protein n=1 Tax=Mycolicibacterium sp. lyk4-40-TYG-92 TaxID=3040295 RepID=UPI00254D1218|nr:heme-binding protein [Mycolicibacterium sp. lyk4-40-TYG-92]
MLNQMRTFTTQVLSPVTSTVGIRSGLEEPPYDAEPLAGGVQIRRYGRRIAAQTSVEGDEEHARNAGFRRLAGYIFGANHQSGGIAMTAPVGQQRRTDTGRKIAMTAPVEQQGSQAGGWVIRFFMPAGSTLESLPTPDDERVELVEVPAETVAVLRFTGDRGADSIARHTDHLRDTLRDYGFAVAGDPSAWFYDPPWTLPWRRRNEIAIPVEN